MGGTPLRIAAFRAGVQAFVTGGLTFFTLWGQTGDWKLIISGTGIAIFTILAGRFGVEGVTDQKRANAASPTG